MWEVDCKSGGTDVLVHGHESTLYGLTVNPAFTHVFATAGESQNLIVWSSATHKVHSSDVLSLLECVCPLFWHLVLLQCCEHVESDQFFNSMKEFLPPWEFPCP